MTTTQGMLIGGVGLTHLRVYHQRPGPDGVHAGCAHVHALTAEAYFGLAGEGAIELHDREAGFTRVPIVAGTYVQFPPGVLHRSVSTDHLEVLAIMGNGGLAERGDARIYFGADVDDDPAAFARLKGLAAEGLDGALERRDASAHAYMHLMALWEDDRDAWRAELGRFVDVHRAAIAADAQSFREAIEARVMAPTLRTLEAIDGLKAAGAGAPRQWALGDAPETLGMCGILRQIADLGPVGSRP
jgi:mannose-6-phosphate isomerase-like protein (cupin superfamily)